MNDKIESKKAKPSETESGTSRRNFLAPAVAGAVAAALIKPDQMLAATTGVIPSIRIPAEFVANMNEPPQVGSFKDKGMNGAEVFARLCKEEELAALFCCPGNYTVINAIAAAGIPAYGGRTEGAMCAAADGFSRVTGEATACSGTEGPGLTH